MPVAAVRVEPTWAVPLMVGVGTVVNVDGVVTGAATTAALAALVFAAVV